MTNLETLKQQTAEMEAKLEESTAKLKEMKAEIERLENGWEMKCPYNYSDSYYFISVNGNVLHTCWCDFEGEKESFEAGNIFKTKKAAELEAKRRNLLTRFRAFRDECNGGWKPDWNDHNSEKWVIAKNEKGIYAMWTFELNTFSYFGVFKNQFDAQRAIDLFGDEIKELFMEEEQHA